jgi:hypothetical protein
MQSEIEGGVRMKIYISGQINWIPEKQALKNFEKAKSQLQRKYPDATIISPMHDIKHEHDKSWESYMKEDIGELLRCDTIAMLPNWGKSKGAKLEYLIATHLDLDVIFI